MPLSRVGTAATNDGFAGKKRHAFMQNATRKETAMRLNVQFENGNSVDATDLAEVFGISTDDAQHVMNALTHGDWSDRDDRHPNRNAIERLKFAGKRLEDLVNDWQPYGWPLTTWPLTTLDMRDASGEAFTVWALQTRDIYDANILWEHGGGTFVISSLGGYIEERENHGIAYRTA